MGAQAYDLGNTKVPYVEGITQAHDVVVKGKVKDKEGNELPGASILVEGTTVGTVTDINGDYSLRFVPKSNQRLIFSFVGLKTKPVAYTGQKELNVTLESGDVALDDVVVIGYGSKNKKSLTSSIASMDKKEVERLAATTTTLDNLLGGTIKGVMTTTTTGEPGSAIKINVRGITSPYTSANGNAPLFVIDGVPMFMGSNALNPLMNIAPSDIESIDVLKDASATAIYGSRGANGVIIVKTKAGRKGEKVNVEAGYTFSVGNPLKSYDFLNTDEFINVQDEILRNTVTATNGGFTQVSDYGLTWIMQKFGKVSTDANGNLVYNGIDRALYGNVNTDWDREMRNKNAQTHQYNVAVRGGSDKTNYSFSFNGLNQEGLLLNDNLERYSARLSMDAEISKRISIGGSLSYSYSNHKGGSLDFGWGGYDYNIWQMRPDVPVYDGNGNLNLMDITGNYYYYGMGVYDSNPVAKKLKRKNEAVNDQFLGNAYMEIELLKGLKVRGDFNISRYLFKTSTFMPASLGMRMGFSPEESELMYPDATLSNSESGVTASSVNFRVDYNLNIDKHGFTVMAGYGADRYWGDGNDYTFTGFPDDDILINQGSATNVDSHSDYYSRSGLNSVYGRLTYDYASRYLAEVSLRADASSKFGPDNRWAVFPAVSLGWRINNENFLKDINQIDDLKLRLSWGKTGSTNVDDFSYKQYYVGNSSYGGQSAVSLLSTLPNKAIGWEMTTEYNIGFDFSFFSGRLNGNLDFYRRYTDGALAPAPMGLESGLSSYTANLIDMVNKGVEFSVGGDVIRTKDFTWNTSFNISTNRSKIKKLNGATLSVYVQDLFTEGMPLGIVKGYKVAGIFQTEQQIERLNAAAPAEAKGKYQGDVSPGDYMIEDTNLDGYITADDKVVIANPEPKCFGGWSNTLSYKDFSLSFLFQYQCGGEATYSNLSSSSMGTLGSNILREMYGNTWTPERADAKYAKLVFASTSRYNSSSNLDRYVFKTSYLRMKNITLSYNLPKIPMRRLGVQNASVFVTATNLFTITQWPGLDPEMVSSIPSQVGNNSDVYPMSRTFSLGLKVQF